jgi:hypothetical protein
MSQRKPKVSVRYGRDLGAKLKNNCIAIRRLYNWQALQSEGDSFVAEGRGVNLRGLRVCASRYGMVRGIVITVNALENGGALVKHCGPRPVTL